MFRSFFLAVTAAVSVVPCKRFRHFSASSLVAWFLLSSGCIQFKYRHLVTPPAGAAIPEDACIDPSGVKRKSLDGMTVGTVYSSPIRPSLLAIRDVRAFESRLGCLDRVSCDADARFVDGSTETRSARDSVCVWTGVVSTAKESGEVRGLGRGKWRLVSASGRIL